MNSLVQDVSHHDLHFLLSHYILSYLLWKPHFSDQNIVDVIEFSSGMMPNPRPWI